MGYFEKGTKNITVCKENAQKRRTPLEVIIKHEYVHFVYDTVGSGFNPIPEPLLTKLVRERIPPGEALFVLLFEKEYTPGEEFTARILADLPDPVFVIWALKAIYLKG